MAVDDHLQKVALAIVVIFPCLATVTLALRLLSRKLLTRHVGLDDWLVVAAWILSVGETFTSYRYIQTNYVGIHYADVPKNYNVELGNKYNFANQITYNPILSLVKISVILFMLRLNGQQRSIKIFAWAVLAITIALMVAIITVVVFQCSPVPFVYDTTIKGGTCINKGAFFVATGCMTLLTDVLVLILPTWITIKLQMPAKQKAAVIGLLSLGLVVTAVGIYRLVLLVGVFFPSTVNTDPTYNIGFCTSAIETNLAIMTACGPALKPLVKRYLPKLLGTSKYGQSSRTGPMYYHHGTGYGRGTQVTVHGGKSMAFEMGGIKKSRKATVSADDDSEKGIITYDAHGINKTVDVSVTYVDQDQNMAGSSSDTSYPIHGNGEGQRTPDAEGPRNSRKMSAERMV